MQPPFGRVGRGFRRGRPVKARALLRPTPARRRMTSGRPGGLFRRGGGENGLARRCGSDVLGQGFHLSCPPRSRRERQRRRCPGPAALGRFRARHPPARSRAGPPVAGSDPGVRSRSAAGRVRASSRRRRGSERLGHGATVRSPDGAAVGAGQLRGSRVKGVRLGRGRDGRSDRTVGPACGRRRRRRAGHRTFGHALEGQATHRPPWKVNGGVRDAEMDPFEVGWEGAPHAWDAVPSPRTI